MEIAEVILAVIGAATVFYGIIYLLVEIESAYTRRSRHLDHLQNASDNHDCRLYRMERELKEITGQVRCNSENIRTIKTSKKK